MRILLPLALGILLTACQREEAAPQPSNEVAAAPAADTTPVPSLDGEWQAAAFNNTPASQPGSVAVRFAAGRAIMTAGCLTRSWGFTQKGNIVAFTAGASGGCNRDYSSDEYVARTAIDGATMALFEEGGRRVTLSGSGGNVTLERR